MVRYFAKPRNSFKLGSIRSVQGGSRPTPSAEACCTCIHVSMKKAADPLRKTVLQRFHDNTSLSATA